MQPQPSRRTPASLTRLRSRRTAPRRRTPSARRTAPVRGIRPGHRIRPRRAVCLAAVAALILAVGTSA
ncbi:hypothetical protein ABT404_31860, partial [Streptomyces hyaluromycini]